MTQQRKPTKQQQQKKVKKLLSNQNPLRKKNANHQHQKAAVNLLKTHADQNVQEIKNRICFYKF